MKIKFKTEKINKKIYIPNILIFNYLSINIINKKMEKQLNTSFFEVNNLNKTIKLSKKVLKDTPLIELHTNENEHIQIFL